MTTTTFYCEKHCEGTIIDNEHMLSFGPSTYIRPIVGACNLLHGMYCEKCNETWNNEFTSSLDIVSIKSLICPICTYDNISPSANFCLNCGWRML